MVKAHSVLLTNPGEDRQVTWSTLHYPLISPLLAYLFLRSVGGSYGAGIFIAGAIAIGRWAIYCCSLALLTHLLHPRFMCANEIALVCPAGIKHG
ncbi:MAG TPA: hypothetical protein VH591_00130 [Ktedonobacterales bacterium]